MKIKLTKKFFLFWFGIIFLTMPLFAQQNETSAKSLREIGLPHIQTFLPRAYNAHFQNWATAQHPQGLVYAANNDGLLEYDGISWRKIKLGNHTQNIRSLAMTDDGRLYAGLGGDLGYFLSDTSGQIRFKSLRLEIPEQYQDFRDVWYILFLKEFVYFISREYVFRWHEDDNKMSLLRPKTNFHTAFVVNDHLYANQLNLGLTVIEADTFRLAAGGDTFEGKRIYMMLPHESGHTLIGTDSDGLYLYDGITVSPFPTEATDYLVEKRLYCAVKPTAGYYAMGTRLGGLVVMDAEGKLLQVLNKDNDLPDNSVWHISADRQNGLWLALNKGIAKVYMPGSVSYFKKANGLNGTVERLHRHKNTLYAATNQGVYYLDTKLKNPESLNSRFRRVLGIPEYSRSFLSYRGKLLAGSINNVFEIKKDHRVTELPGEHTSIFAFAVSREDSKRVYLAAEEGLGVLHYSGGQWLDGGHVPGIREKIYSIIEGEPGKLWLETFRDGVMWAEIFSKESGLSARSVHYDTSNGLPPGIIKPVKIGALTRFANTRGLWQFDEENQQFLPDTAFQLQRQLLFLGVNDLSGRLLITTRAFDQKDEQIYRATMIEKNGYRWDYKTFLQIPDLNFVSTLFPETNYLSWIGTTEGVIRFDERLSTNNDIDFSALIRRVTAGEDAVLFNGIAASRNKFAFENIANGEAVPILDYSENTIRFEFAAPFSGKGEQTKYRTQLEGFRNEWSNWRAESREDFTNLWEGEYTFRVQAQNLFGEISRDAHFSFTILAPWYRTLWAYLFYAFFSGAFIFGLVRLQAERVRKREQEIAQLKEAKLIRLQNIELQEKNAEIVRTQQQLIVQEKLASLGALTAGIAHEIKNPLNFVNNFSSLSVEILQELKEILENDEHSPDAQASEDVQSALETLEELVSKINLHGKKADRIVEQMLLHSRRKANKKSILVKFNILLDEHVKLALHSLHTDKNIPNIKVNRNYDQAIDEVKIIPENIGKALLNIINNACYAAVHSQKVSNADVEPTVSITSIDQEKHIEIHIWDIGDGIPEEIRDKIFNPFFTTKSTGKGVGLGLSIAHDIIVQEHFGSIDITSEAGEFTNVIIRLPK